MLMALEENERFLDNIMTFDEPTFSILINNTLEYTLLNYQQLTQQ